jgi:hypothetical protein
MTTMVWVITGKLVYMRESDKSHAEVDYNVLGKARENQT